jgi:glutathione synthase/RimK-type ligase-like ATP-grasp enzyme
VKNSERVMVPIIQEICREEEIDCVSFSYDWILRLQKSGKSGFIFGYNFGINNAAAARICDDKCAVSDILDYFGVSSIEHKFFMAPENLHYVGEKGNWEQIIEFFEDHGSIVCKSNVGTGGEAVFLVKNRLQLEYAVHEIFKQSRSIALCNYYDILKEYRVIVLKGEVKLAYAKNIPFVVGDGRKNLRQLIIEYMNENQIILNLDYEEKTYEKIFRDGKVWNIDWKSNLGKGATPEIVTDQKLLADLSALAIKAAEAISIEFASVDIVNTLYGLMVLEVNCGIMMESFIRFIPENYYVAKKIYKEAVLEMMGKQ